MFGRVKEWRRTAIRYDRLAGNFLSAIKRIASACLWIALSAIMPWLFYEGDSRFSSAQMREPKTIAL
jgi:hypothetical protein